MSGCCMYVVVCGDGEISAVFGCSMYVVVCGDGEI